MNRKIQNSLDEGMFVEINGIDQWVTFRGSDRANPALLILSGPGAAFGSLAPFFAPWEEDFTLVQWDQPGAGATHGKNGDAGTGPLTYERIARDGIAVAEFACRHLQTSKLVVLGFSGGTIVGLLLVKQRPDLFSAYVGSGQIVDWPRQDAISYELLLERARNASDASMLADLERIGAPPYPDTATDAVKSKYAGAMTDKEKAAMAALDPSVLAAMQAPPAGATYIAPGIAYEPMFARAMAAYDAMRNEVVTFDAWKLGLEFEVPMFFLQGEDDTMTVTSEVERYAADVKAPLKRFVPLKGAGHSTHLLRDELLRLLVAHVRPVAVSDRVVS